MRRIEDIAFKAVMVHQIFSAAANLKILQHTVWALMLEHSQAEIKH